MKKQEKLILQIIIIVALLLTIFSLILPWAHYSIPSSSGKLELYNWGAHSMNYNFFNQSNFFRDSWIPYLGLPDFNRMLQGVDNPIIRVSWVLALTIFPLVVIGLCFGLFGYQKYGEKFDTFFICFSAILFLISIIVFFIFIQFGISSLMIHTNLSDTNSSIGLGFVFIIVATIILFIVHFIQYVIDIK